MLPPKQLGRDGAPPPPQIIERPVLDDTKLWALQERVVRIENDRKWLHTGLLVVLIGAGILGPGIGIWMSEQRAARYAEETARIERRVDEVDSDVGELLNAVLAMAEERLEDRAIARARTPPTAAARRATNRRGAAAPTGASAPAGADPRSRPPNPKDWAEAIGARILAGPLKPQERSALRAQWDTLTPSLQDQTLTALLRRYGIDPEAFLQAIEEPPPEDG